MGAPKDYVFPSTKYPALLTIPKGGELGIKIPCIRRGVVTKLLVKQIDLTTGDLLPVSGDLTGFSYQLYNTVAACPPGTSPTATAIANGVVASAYGISPLITVASGDSEFVSGEGFPEDGVHNLQLGYSCLDGRTQNTNQTLALAAGPSSEDNNIYLKITTPDTGISANKSFMVALTIEDPILA